MANDDYGYFGKGDTGYAQYMTAFNRNFGGSSGGVAAATTMVAAVVETEAAAAASSPLRWWSCWCFSAWEAEGISTARGCLRDPVTENLTRKCYHIVTGNTNNIPMEDFNMKAKFYICEHCGNLVTTIHNAGVPLVCCGEKMKELLPNTVEASGEKHLPVAELSGSTLTVTVGAVEHPMVDVHHIQWLFVETENGGQLRYLTPGQAPKAVFELGSEKPVAVYAYCNLHGLWMTKL